MDWNQNIFLIGILANAIAAGRNSEETALIGTHLTLLGDALATISAQQSFTQKDK